jgi:4-alpha-glucanotransferase
LAIADETIDPTMSERSRRWGIMPSYFGWQGDLKETTAETEQAILESMGASRDRPPRLRRPGLSPDPCSPAPDRAWGWALQLYSLRSRESWGIGDLADLRRFGRWSKRAGASVILLNPLGAQSPAQPYEASPYYASTRRFRNVVYLRIEEIDGAAASAAGLAPLAAVARELNRQPVIDYDQVYRLKSQALELVFQAAPRPNGFDAFARRQGAALRDFALFNALCELHGPAWRTWPHELRHPGGPGLETVRDQLAERVAFHQWLQFHLDRQLARAGREIGLIMDVPVGFASDGFDAWRWQDSFAPRMRVGAPPDEFFRDGQDWGLPPLDPWKLGKASWEPFVDAIRSASRHAAGIRLDHVMGLFRLFWIPDGMGAPQGAYVRYPAAILLGLLARESRRAGAFVVGEDLGLVEPTVRRHLRRRGSMSYRLLWFESSDPSSWPRDAVAAVGTHDLPTVAGIWMLTEPDQRLHHLREKLVSMTHLPDSTPPIDVAVAAYTALARGRPRIVLASLEDALGVHQRPNVPGTTTEFPNWRRALPLELEEVEAADGVRRIAEAMRASGR